MSPFQSDYKFNLLTEFFFFMSALVLVISMWNLYRTYGRDKLWAVALVGISFYFAGTALDLFDNFYSLSENIVVIMKCFLAGGIFVFSCGMVIIVHLLLNKTDIDPLTGLYNKKYFKKLFIQEIGRSQRFNIPFSILFIDLDNFKEINDSMGHSTGDIVLCTVVENIKETIRTVDIFARYGGDEFVLLLPHTTQDNAKILLKRFQRMISELKFPRDIRIGISGGIAVFPYDGKIVDQLIDIADKRMYENKFKRKRHWSNPPA